MSHDRIRLTLGHLLLVTTLLVSGCAFVVRLPAFKIDTSTRDDHVFRGAYHVHSEFSHDSKASLSRIIDTAERADLDFVVITDHNTITGAEVYKNMNPPRRPLASGPRKAQQGSQGAVWPHAPPST